MSEFTASDAQQETTPADAVPSGGLASRRAAFALLEAVLARKRPLDEALEREAAFTALPEARDRAFARLLTLTVLRRMGQLDQLIDRYLDREPKGRARALRQVLRLGLAQLVFLGTPAHAAVDTTVGLAEAERLAAFKGLVNAILRRAAREAGELARAQDPARLNLPAWLRESWTAAYGEAAGRALAEALLTEPPLDLTLKDPATAGDWAARLGAERFEATTLRLHQAGDVRALPGYADGAWWVQDAAAALPARILEAAAGGLAGRAVIDLCAAPGGKTAQLAAMGAEVTAVDRAAKRLERLSANLARLDLAAETVAADAAEWRPATPADALLLDAPCTATGTLRRHPDIGYLKGPEDVARLAALQARLIAAAADMLRPGGVMVYATCSLQPEEGEGAVRAALDAGAPLRLRPIKAGWLGGFAESLTADGGLRTLPYHRGEAGGCDGFYACLLERADE